MASKWLKTTAIRPGGRKFVGACEGARRLGSSTANFSVAALLGRGVQSAGGRGGAPGQGTAAPMGQSAE